MTKGPTVAVVEWNWGGHHPEFFSHCVSSLGACGAVVVPFVSEASKCMEVLGPCFQAGGPGGAGWLLRPSEFVPSRLWRFRPSRSLALHFRARSTFQRLGAALSDWETVNGMRVDLVYFACMYDDDFPRAELVSRGLGRPWSGLYLQGRVFHRLRGSPEHRMARRARGMFRSPALVALGVLEPWMLTLISKASSDVNAREFPDNVGTIPRLDTPAGLRLREEMRSRAAGRPIVSLLGHLKPSKGVELFLRVACSTEMQDVAFFLGGEMRLKDFDPAIRGRIQELLQRAPHLQRCPGRLGDDVFHAAIAASDLIFCAYVDFPHSSNIQGKAALFHRPTIVTEGTLMAERCRAYRLGECILENDLDDAIGSIRRLLSSAKEWQADLEGRRLRETFVALNGSGALADAMSWVLASHARRCVGVPSPRLTS